MGEAICSRCGKGPFVDGGVFLSKVRETCFNFLLSARDEKLVTCMNSLRRPAAILAADHTVLMSNVFLAENPEPQQKIGDVLECVNAASSNGCGSTTACRLCGIRRSVEHTLATGGGVSQCFTDVQKRSGARQTIILSTEKAADAVLLVFGAPAEEIPL